MDTAPSAGIIIPMIVESRYALDHVPYVLRRSFFSCISQCKYVVSVVIVIQFGVSVFHFDRGISVFLYVSLMNGFLCYAFA